MSQLREILKITALFGVVQFSGFYGGVFLTLQEVTTNNAKKTKQPCTEKAFGVEFTSVPKTPTN